MSRAAQTGCRALRKGRVNIAGQIYSLTTVTAARRRLFLDLHDARAVVLAMREVHEAELVESLAFVVMPDHVHWLIALGHRPLGDVMRLFKARSAGRINSRHGWRHPVWQRGYYDHAVRREENVAAIGRYIVLNPVRAGLVNCIAAYPFWDCAWL
ncbi:MAG: transposase [Gammaproteobacteria bacterium]|nr:MAG: transposase [Gammaproteobacteria bacterium]